MLDSRCAYGTFQFLPSQQVVTFSRGQNERARPELAIFPVSVVNRGIYRGRVPGRGGGGGSPEIEGVKRSEPLSAS